jgi:hypothetical protein
MPASALSLEFMIQIPLLLGHTLCEGQTITRQSRGWKTAAWRISRIDLPSTASFRKRFTFPIERDGDDEVAERLRRITAPFVLRLWMTGRLIIRDLPDKLEMKELCTLTREYASLYQAVVDDMLARIEEPKALSARVSCSPPRAEVRDVNLLDSFAAASLRAALRTNFSPVVRQPLERIDER